MKQRFQFAFSLLLSIAGLPLGAPASAGVPLNNPNGVEIYFLQQEYAHTAPDLDSLAQTDFSVQTADEFHKQNVINQVVGQLKQQEKSIQGVSTITVDLNTTFSPYDSDYGEYDFDISDGTGITYPVFQKMVQIALTNGTDAQSWSVKPDIAEAVLKKTNGSRQVTLALKLQLEPSPPGVDGQPCVLNARILSYDILTQFGGIRLGHVDVKDGE